MRTLAVTLLIAAAATAKSPRTLWGIKWQPSLGKARVAAAEMRQQRPVVWLRMLGDLVGKT